MFFKKKKSKENVHDKDNKEFQHADLKFPRCNIVMKKLHHPSKAILDVCEKCGGMWLDKDEVLLLYKDKEKKITKKDNKEEDKNEKEEINK